MKKRAIIIITILLLILGGFAYVEVGSKKAENQMKEYLQTNGY